MAVSQLSPEDTVWYRLYLGGRVDPSSDRLTSQAVECCHFVRSMTEGYVWHYEKFGLSIWAENTAEQCPSHLCGSVCFRDNVEDEWLVVWLLFELSLRHPQLVISVCDGDGEFLLIEAALQLAKWLKPETAENRVFISRGCLHIIPKPRSPAEMTVLPIATPTIREAIKLVGGEFPTEAPPPVQAAIQKKIERFSGGLQSFLHRTHVYLPCPAAHVMSHDPQLVSAAVHALCDRDPLDMKACRKLDHFSPSRHPSIMITVTFSRLLYAQLLHQSFTTPRNSGFQLHPTTSKLHKPCDLGVKLTCGLEILVSRVSGEGGDGVRVVEDDPRWSKFLQSLSDNGYFQNEIEGSKLHQKLMATAKEYFSESVQKESTTRDDNGKTPTSTKSTLLEAGGRIADLLKATPYSEEQLRQRWTHVDPPDDESWLEISPGELDDMMRRAAGYLPKERDSEEDLQSMAFGMKSFVDKVSSHEGAEFPWSAEDVTGIELNPDTFMESMQAMLDGREEEEEGEGERGCGSEDDDDALSISDGVMSEGGEGGDGELAEVMQQMDQELAQTEVGKSFERLKVSDQNLCEGGDAGEGGEGVQPVDVDFNLVKNLLESYSSQGGVAGPASNILQSLGVHIPADPPSSSGTPSASGTPTDQH